MKNTYDSNCCWHTPQKIKMGPANFPILTIRLTKNAHLKLTSERSLRITSTGARSKRPDTSRPSQYLLRLGPIFPTSAPKGTARNSSKGIQSPNKPRLTYQDQRDRRRSAEYRKTTSRNNDTMVFAFSKVDVVKNLLINPPLSSTLSDLLAAG